MSVRDAVEKLSKVFAQEPDKACSKNPPATATLDGGLKFQVTGPHGEALFTDMPPSVLSESDSRGLLGTDDGVSAGLFGLRTHVKIAGEGATADQLQEIVRWADAHSPVGCTIRRSPANALEIEVV